MQATILVVDDTPTNISVLMEILRGDYRVRAAVNGEHADGLVSMARLIALHHEKWDGTGYHRGLKREEIPLVGRITSIADLFDALTSTRPYKKAWAIEDAVALLQREAGTSFDPELVKTFVAILPQILAVREKYSDAPHTAS
jgi:putative two-component system response regulator